MWLPWYRDLIPFHSGPKEVETIWKTPMRAAIVERPNTLIVRDVPEGVRGEYDALCQLEYGLTCTGTD